MEEELEEELEEKDPEPRRTGTETGTGETPAAVEDPGVGVYGGGESMCIVPYVGVGSCFVMSPIPQVRRMTGNN